MSPTQQRLYDMLSDGKRHSRVELCSQLWEPDCTNPNAALAYHICKLRQYADVVYESDGYRIRVLRQVECRIV